LARFNADRESGSGAGFGSSKSRLEVVQEVKEPTPSIAVRFARVPTSTVEDYLKQILLEEQRQPGIRVSTGTLATALRVTPGSVTAMMKALADGGLVEHQPYGGVELTAAGRQLALHVVRRHRLIELFLVRVLKLDWSEVHDEAEQLEHAVSERVVDRLDELLGHPDADPHGDPIPTAAGEVEAAPRVSLDAVGAGMRVRVSRVSDQDPAFLRLIERLGLRPGVRVRVASRDAESDTLELDLGRGRRATLGLRAAARILVEPG
jgi:DtxR family Mn-dependent transcriptional regulator